MVCTMPAFIFLNSISKEQRWASLSRWSRLRVRIPVAVCSLFGGYCSLEPSALPVCSPLTSGYYWVYVLCSGAWIMSSFLQPHGPQPARLLCSWDFPSNSSGVGCYALFQGIFPAQGSNSRLLHLLQYRWILFLLSHRDSPWYRPLLNPHQVQHSKLQWAFWERHLAEGLWAFLS